ncbi:MAG: DUF378 domain-containing protein [bacterium]|nr:DUF378 domain-containing protein [bacterium]
MAGLRIFSKWLVTIGAINIGLVQVLKFDLVDSVFGSWPSIERLVLILIGVAGVWGAYGLLTKKGKK